ncbi:MAG: hypothetical protein Q4C67_09570 [Deinococcus sp.]|nr:hypothetical protein [Deinococcus sp.]
MKKTLIALTILGGAFATNASAVSYGGIHAGNGLGVHYQTDIDADSAYRVGVGFQGDAIGASADYLNRVDRNPVGNGFVPYYGAGVGVGFAGGVSFSPRAFVGTDFVVNQNARAFGEVGPKVTLNNAGGAGVGLHGRVGVNFRLN